MPPQRCRPDQFRARSLWAILNPGKVVRPWSPAAAGQAQPTLAAVALPPAQPLNAEHQAPANKLVMAKGTNFIVDPKTL
jgi:hypothetical protein